MGGCVDKSVVNRDGVQVRKVVVDEGSTVSVDFTIESGHESPVVVRVRDAVPHGVNVSDLGFTARDGEYCWQLEPSGDLVLERVLTPGESVFATYTLDEIEADSSRAATIPSVEAIRPIDGEDAGVGDEIRPLWGDGGTRLAASDVSPYDGSWSPDVERIEDSPTVTRRDSPNPPDVLVAIPAYNEEASIAHVVERVSERADRVLVINDGSTDDTGAQACEAGASVVRHSRNRGYGAALKTAFVEAKECNASQLIIIDGDGQHDPADIALLVDRQRTTDAEIVIGNRYAGSRSAVPRYRRFGLWMVNTMTNLSMGALRPSSWIGDTQSGFRAYNRQAIETLAEDEYIGERMSASTDILYHARRHGYDIEEVGIVISYDVENGSTHNPLAHGLGLVSNILRVIEWTHPLSALGLPGLISTLVGVGFAYWALANFTQSGIFPLGLAITATFFVLVGIFACFTAIVLHSLKTHLSNPSAA